MKFRPGYLFFATAIGLILSIFFYWLGHPELTEMQMFLANLWKYVAAFILILIGFLWEYWDE